MDTMDTMDTISNLAAAASKAIWGENKAGEEPVSGEMGNVAAGEPYDAGNIGEPNSAALSSTEQQSSKNPTANTSSERVDEPANGSSIASAPEAETDKQQNQTATSRGKPAGPAETAPSATAMRDDSTKAQNDTRPPPPPASSSPSTSGGGGGGGEAKPERATPPAAEAKEDDNPVKVEGPGPRPVEEIAREHGGDAGAAKPESLEGDRAAGQGEDEGAGAPRRDSAKSLGEGGEGEQCVQSSGLAADGGDFDAARPGAGKEADRLLEQKGVHEGDTAGDKHGHEGGAKEKMGLKDKIKAKLHKSTISA